MSISEQSNQDNEYNEADKAYSWGVVADGMKVWQHPIFESVSEATEIEKLSHRRFSKSHSIIRLMHASSF